MTSESAGRTRGSSKLEVSDPAALGGGSGGQLDQVAYLHPGLGVATPTGQGGAALVVERFEPSTGPELALGGWRSRFGSFSVVCPSSAGGVPFACQVRRVTLNLGQQGRPVTEIAGAAVTADLHLIDR